MEAKHVISVLDSCQNVNSQDDIQSEQERTSHIKPQKKEVVEVLRLHHTVVSTRNTDTHPLISRDADKSVEKLFGYLV